MYPGGTGYEAAVQTAEAKAVCAHCSVRPECLELALRLEGDATAAYRGGVWGGLDARQRARMARKQVAA
jgi:WhiB family redox-sensing transcriptional regulator